MPLSSVETLDLSGASFVIGLPHSTERSASPEASRLGAECQMPKTSTQCRPTWGWGETIIRKPSVLLPSLWGGWVMESVTWR